jgi:hypothetical protein
VHQQFESEKFGTAEEEWRHEPGTPEPSASRQRPMVKTSGLHVFYEFML